MAERTCPECGVTVTGPLNKRFCTERCRKQAENRRLKRAHHCVCTHCGRGFSATKARAIYCSLTCDSAAKAIRLSRTLSSPLVWRQCRTCGWWRCHGNGCPKRSAHPVMTAPPFDCIVCGTHVVPGREGAHWPAHRYCSRACRTTSSNRRQRDNGNARAARERRRARKVGAYVGDVSRPAIYLRDGWRCQLCGRPLKRNASPPHPLAPTIDHVIPLSRGGTHEPANAQAAHFLCNSLKGDRSGPQGDQLRLIG
jgi:hypothetical protein